LPPPMGVRSPWLAVNGEHALNAENNKTKKFNDILDPEAA